MSVDLSIHMKNRVVIKLEKHCLSQIKLSLTLANHCFGRIYSISVTIGCNDYLVSTSVYVFQFGSFLQGLGCSTHVFSSLFFHISIIWICLLTTMVNVIRWTGKSTDFSNICHLSTLFGNSKSTGNDRQNFARFARKSLCLWVPFHESERDRIIQKITFIY